MPHIEVSVGKATPRAFALTGLVSICVGAEIDRSLHPDPKATVKLHLKYYSNDSNL